MRLCVPKLFLTKKISKIIPRDRSLQKCVFSGVILGQRFSQKYLPYDSNTGARQLVHAFYHPEYKRYLQFL